MASSSRYGLIAGNGRFPFLVLEAARSQGIDMTFYGSGWGHGVGMCQVGAFGMAMDGARFDEILKTYYTGIDLKKMY